MTKEEIEEKVREYFEENPPTHYVEDLGENVGQYRYKIVTNGRVMYTTKAGMELFNKEFSKQLQNDIERFQQGH